MARLLYLILPKPFDYWCITKRGNNSLGRLIRKVQAVGLNNFNFLGEELYYVENAKIKFLDLFTAESRELPLPEPAQFVLLTDERMILTTSNRVEIFEFIP